jgi:peroxiredoxin
MFSQEITEENYLKADKEIWDTYEQDCAKAIEQKKKFPEKKDSLNLILAQLLEIANEKNCNAAIKFASVPSGLKRLFWVRLNLHKDTLFAIINSLPKEMQESNYGKSLLLHINSKQIVEGDKYFDFDATDTLGNNVKFSSLRSNYTFLIYDGLSCMGEANRELLNKLYDETQRKNLQIIYYSKCTDLMQLKELKEKYKVKYPLLSDFLNDHSPMKIHYGLQTTPTCILISKDGTVFFKTEGVPDEKLKVMKEKKLF